MGFAQRIVGFIRLSITLLTLVLVVPSIIEINVILNDDSWETVDAVVTNIELNRRERIRRPGEYFRLTMLTNPNEVPAFISDVKPGDIPIFISFFNNPARRTAEKYSLGDEVVIFHSPGGKYYLEKGSINLMVAILCFCIIWWAHLIIVLIRNI